VAIEIRPVLGYDDLATWVQVRNEVVPDDPETVEMMALVRARELDRADLLAFVDGEPAGTGMLAGDPASVSSSQPYVDVRVREPLRRRGVGTALVRELVVHALGLGKDGFECAVMSSDPESIGYVERRGYSPIGTTDQWVLDLAGDLPGHGPPAGVEIGWLAERPHLMNAMYEVAAEVYPEYGGWVARQVDTMQDWLVYELGNPSLPVELTSLAMTGEGVVGFSTFIGLHDGRAASHRMVAVARAWRGRGVGRALISAQLRGARDAGYERMVAWRRGNAPDRAFTSLGFERGHSWTVYRGPLP
jgi:mycothiol synthase